MLEKPETMQILKKMLVIAAVSLLFIPLLDVFINLEFLSPEVHAMFRLIQNPIAYFIALFLWFRVLIFLVTTYMGKEDLSKDLSSTSMVIIIGFMVQEIHLSSLAVFHEVFSAVSPFVSSLGTLILLFGFITLFYHLMKYIWVKI